MPVVTFVDPDTVHNPSSGTAAPASWFTNQESNFRSIGGRVSARIHNDTTEDYAIPGPTTLLLPDTGWNNGMTLSTANTIIVPASYGGKYLISGNLRVTSVPSALNTVQLGVAVNGTVVMQEISSRSTVTGFLDTLSRSFVYALAVADAVTLSCTTTGLSDADTEVSLAYPSLTLFWLSA